MIDAFSRRVLDRRPNIQFVGPRSVDTIPEPSPSVAETTRTERIQQLVDGLKNVSAAAVLAEDLIAERAKDVTLTLDLNDPEDFATAQAAARCFPDKACDVEGLPGIKVVCEITFPMYRECTQGLKQHGLQVGQQNQIPAVNPGAKTDFGQATADRRPQINQMSAVMPPVSIPAYMIAAIPLLFLMMQPLRSLYVNTKIIGHTHNIVTPAPLSPVGPGLPVVPT